jgi:hypothetical protein
MIRLYAKTLIEHPGHADQSVHDPRRKGGDYHVSSFRVQPSKSGGGGKMTVTRKHASDSYGMDATQRTYVLRGKRFASTMKRIGSLERRGVVGKSGVEGMYRRTVSARPEGWGRTGHGYGSI